MGRKLAWPKYALQRALCGSSTQTGKILVGFHSLRWHVLALACLQILLAASASAATQVQQAANGNVDGSTMASISATFSMPTTSGDAVILGVTFGNVNPTITATDSQGNVYVQAIKIYDSAHRQGSAILYALNITGGSKNTVTVKFSKAVAYLAVGIHEYNGIAGASALDGTTGRMGAGSAPSSGSISTTQNGDLLFGCGVEDSAGHGDTFTAGPGFAERVDLGNAAAYADEDEAQLLSGTTSASWTLSPARSWIATIAAFKAGPSSSPQDSAPPSISSLSPAAGPVGASVTIAGTNFGQTQGTSTVSFSGIPASTTSWGSTRVVATVPSGAVTGNVNIAVQGVTSNSEPFSVSQVAVTVSPLSSSLQAGQSQLFNASLQNDIQNKGVTWGLVGSGCSGLACGALRNVTNSSATYIAPTTLPSSAQVLLQATSVADSTKSSSATITFVAATAISVTVSPSSTSAQVSTSTDLAAAVLNDPQNGGVTWNLSGDGCSGSSCGALTNQTPTGVTYTAPSSVPSVPTVILTATSVTDSTKTATSSIAVTQPASGGGIPTFAENHVSGSNTQGNPVSTYILRLPNPSLTGNCIVVGFQYSDTSGVSASVRDDQGDIYSTPLRSTDGRQVVNISYALNVAPGAQKITITFSGGAPNYVSAVASEFYNVAASNALDGNSGNSGTGTSVPAGTLTPTGSGDLIYQYAIQDSSSAPMTSWSQGAYPWALLSADLLDGAAVQYQVQSSAGSITPTLSMAPALGFNSIAIALKGASTGTPPPSGIRVVRVQHNSIQPYASSPVHLQFPSTGNLLIVSWIGVPGHDLSGITDGNSNSYLSTGPAFGYGLSGDNQIFYAASATTGTTLTGPNLSTTGTDISGSTAVLFDIRGAAVAPYDKTAGRATASGTLNTSTNVAAANLLPSTSNGLVISSIGIDSNTIAGVSPGNFLSTLPSPVASPNPVNQNNGWALFYNTLASPCSFVWSPQGGPVEDWASIAVAFMAAPN